MTQAKVGLLGWLEEFLTPPQFRPGPTPPPYPIKLRAHLLAEDRARDAYSIVFRDQVARGASPKEAVEFAEDYRAAVYDLHFTRYIEDHGDQEQGADQ